MNFRTALAGAVLTAAAVCAAPAIASADDPEFPRNGVIPVGDYHITRHASNVVGSPIENCDLRVFDDARNVELICGATVRHGVQTPVGPDETYVTFDGIPVGLALRDIDPRQGFWIGTANLAGTPLQAPYPLTGVSLNRK